MRGLLVALTFAFACLQGAALRAAPPPIEAYGKLPGIEDVSLSPSGKRIALIGAIGEQRKLVVTEVGGAPVFAANVGTAKVRDVDWAGEDRLLVTLTQTVDLGMDFSIDRAELAGVLVINITTKKVFSVFDHKRDISHVVVGQYGAQEIDGHWYGFFGGVTGTRNSNDASYFDHTYPDLYQVDLDTGEARKIAGGSEDIEGWVVAAGGQVTARATYSQASGDWAVLSGGSGRTVLASGNEKLGGVGISMGRTPNQLLLRRPTGEGYVTEEISLTGAKLDMPPIEGAWGHGLHDRETGTWIGYVPAGDAPEVRMFDPQIQGKVSGARKAFPNLSVSLMSWSRDFSRLVERTSGTGDSGSYWLVDIPTGKATPIGYEYPEVGPDDVGPIKLVEWKAADGLTIHGVLTLPPGREARNLPAVVLPHGGPEARDHPVFDYWAQAFASRGYAVLQPNFRGSSGYGVKFRDAGFGEWGRKMQTDVSDGLRSLADQGVVDPKRACIVGGSYGGYAALAGVTVQHGFYRCAVSVAGVSDPGAMLSQSRIATGFWSSTARYWRKFMGPEERFAEISPLRRASEADAPIMLIHGKDDTVVGFEQSASMERALRAVGKPVELVVMPGEDHWLSREATRVMMLKAAVGFVGMHNPAN